MLTVKQRLQLAEQQCQANQSRLTSIRKEILTLIYSCPAPLTAYELLRLLRKDYPKAESMTIYRALDFLQQQQLIHRIASHNAYTACQHPELAHHAQILLCEQCGHAQEIESKPLERALQKTAEEYHFILSGKPTEIIGICQSCYIS